MKSNVSISKYTHVAIFTRVITDAEAELPVTPGGPGTRCVTARPGRALMGWPGGAS